MIVFAYPAKTPVRRQMVEGDDVLSAKDERLLHGVLDLAHIAGPGILEKGFRDIGGYRPIVFLNVTPTLMLHTTLFLFKSTTLDGAHPAVSVYILYLKQNITVLSTPGIDFAYALDSIAR